MQSSRRQGGKNHVEHSKEEVNKVSMNRYEEKNTIIRI